MLRFLYFCSNSAKLGVKMILSSFFYLIYSAFFSLVIFDFLAILIFLPIYNYNQYLIIIFFLIEFLTDLFGEPNLCTMCIGMQCTFVNVCYANCEHDLIQSKACEPNISKLNALQCNSTV